MTDGDDANDGGRSDDGTGDGDSLADRFEGVRASLDGAAEVAGATVRRGGEALDDSTADARRDAAAGVGTVADRVRAGLETTRRSAEALVSDEGGEVPTDPLPVERAPGLDATGRSVRRAGDSARSLVLDGALPVRRAAADAGLRARAGVRVGLAEVTHTVRNADTREVALWGVGTSLALSNPAIAASYSTYALLSAAMAAGMGIGAYVSSHEDTPLDDVDPLTLGRDARRGSRAGRRLGGTAALAGAASVVGSRVADETATGTEGSGYGDWLANADVEAVLAGARRAAEHERGDPWAPVFGAGLGLLAGYVDDGDDEELRRLLDDDLRREFDERTGALEIEEE
ncbi:hypothetical protein [Halomarina litorea]|uniref:hypothetical protein n=1 Tax=Halomarina litorea TaxID=2961595 RepID=UPI0020C3989D|nr:hypothetical protein [Halomarina sp. BCD28]